MYIYRSRNNHFTLKGNCEKDVSKLCLAARVTTAHLGTQYISEFESHKNIYMIKKNVTSNWFCSLIFIHSFTSELYSFTKTETRTTLSPWKSPPSLATECLKGSYLEMRFVVGIKNTWVSKYLLWKEDVHSSLIAFKMITCYNTNLLVLMKYVARIKFITFLFPSSNGDWKITNDASYLHYISAG